MSRYRKLTMIAAVAALAFGLAACGSSSDDDAAMVEPQPTSYETARTNIAAADTAAAAQAAYDAVKDDVTAAEGETLQAAVDTRTTALATMARAAMQRSELMTAAGAVDTSDLSTQEAVDAARDAIAALRGALDAAADVSDADKAMYMSQLDGAVADVDAAQGGLDTATLRTNQMAALTSASKTLQAALAAFSGQTPTQAQLDAANMARTALNAAITGGMDLTDTEKAPYQREAANAAAPITTAQAAFDDAEDDAKKAANMAMAATAAKLYAGIGDAPLDDDDRSAKYDGAKIEVNIKTSKQTLTVDKKTTVAAHHGWEGKQYTAALKEKGTYTAVVYSNVEAPKPGEKFSVQYTAHFKDGVLGPNVLGADKPAFDFAENAGEVASSSFDHSAGKKEFKLPDPNPRGETKIDIDGSFHGVSGTYTCVFTTGTCSSTVADKGFTLAGGTWTFEPTDPDALVMSSADTDYASYGWWIHKSAAGAYTVSAFADKKGTLTAVSGIGSLMGTATYMGGAAGQYALSSSTGGTNDAGDFTADAVLEADFGAKDDTISGTIDNFMGADGEARDWSVKLKKSGISDSGLIQAADGKDVEKNNPLKQTVWTIGGTAASDAGEWSGSLQDKGDDGVPKVATGTFHSTYGTAGSMVGAFGANKQ